MSATITVTGTAAEIIQIGEVLKRGIEAMNSEVDPQILKYLRENKRLDAIKYYRTASGQGLYEAKRYIDKVSHDTGIGVE